MPSSSETPCLRLLHPASTRVRGNVAQRSIGGFRAAAETTYAIGDRQDEAAVDANDGDPVQAPARSRVENGLGDFEEDFGLARHGETIHCSRSPWGKRETRSAQINFRLAEQRVIALGEPPRRCPFPKLKWADLPRQGRLAEIVGPLLHAGAMRKKQLSFPCKGHGGWRPNAGRPNGTRVTHHGRDEVDARHPVHLVWRAMEDVPSLRRNAVYPKVVAVIRKKCKREDFRIVYACVLGNHLHLVAECDSAEALSRGMASLGTSIAMRVNRITGHRGAVFQDRYFVRELRTPTEVARAVAYVVGNEKHHGFEQRAPPPLAPPATWLLCEGWKRVGSTGEGIDLGRPRPSPGSGEDDAHPAAVP